MRRRPSPRARLLIWTVLGGVAGLLTALFAGPSLDGGYFTVSARQALSEAGLHVYADKGLQAGPWQLAVFALLNTDVVYAVVASALSAAAVVLVVRAVRAGEGLADAPAVEAVVLALALGWGAVTGVYASGHPAELVVPLLWGLAVVAAREDRAVVAGLFVGMGAGFETWALLGLPVLLLLPSLRRAPLSAATAVAVAATAYLPFVLAGPFRMGQAQWAIAPGTLVHALFRADVSFTWFARLLQAVIVVAVGLSVALLVRRDVRTRERYAVWLLPAMLGLTKVLTDPMPRDYYWLPVQLALLVGMVALGRRDPARLLLVGFAEAVALVNPLQWWPIEIVALGALLLVASNVELRPGWRLRRQETVGLAA